MSEPIVRDITEDEVTRFETDGVVFLPGLFDRDWVEMLRERADHVLDRPGELHHELAKGDDAGRFFSDTFLWHQNEGFRDFIYRSPAAAIAGQLLRSTKINIVFDQFLIKEADTREPTVWHHDATYWPIFGQQICTVWLALDDVTAESGAMEFVKGSHRWGRFQPIAFVDPDKYKSDLAPVPDIEAKRDELEFIRYEYQPGDCTVHHGLLVHGAGGNARRDRRRRAYVTRWAGDDVVYDPRPNIQPILWDPEIPPGGSLDSKLWPTVWRRDAE